MVSDGAPPDKAKLAGGLVKTHEAAGVPGGYRDPCIVLRHVRVRGAGSGEGEREIRRAGARGRRTALHGPNLGWVRGAVRAAGLTAPQLNVYLFLLDQAETLPDTDPYCRPSVAGIAQGCGLHQRTVQNATRALRDKGLIRVSAQRAGMSVKGRRSPNIYYITKLPPGWQAE